MAQAAKQKAKTEKVYEKRFDQIANRFCLKGATTEELAEAFGVSDRTVKNWIVKHQSFREAVKDGKDEADSHVAQAMFNCALGFTHKQQKPFVDKMGNKVVVTYDEYYPPNVTAQIFWQKNRQAKYWREKREEKTDDIPQSIEFHFATIPDKPYVEPIDPVA